jgi:tRNA(Ile)-lysidine synthase
MDSFESCLQNAWPATHWRDVTLILAVSGGADSTALLRAMHALSSQLRTGRILVAHFNHNLRGMESGADEQFVRQLASQCGFDCKVGQAAPRLLAEVSEDDARQERYRFLTTTAAARGARYVVLAHNANDQAETILMRILRGTGIHGIQGMPATRALTPMVSVVRPLLERQRGEVLEYLERLGQSYRTDSSNVDLQFARNRLRHEILPHLQQHYDPHIYDTLLSLGAQATAMAAETKLAVESLLPTVAVYERAGFTLQVTPLQSESPHVVRELLRYLWRQFDWPQGEMSSARWQELYLLFLGGDAIRLFPGVIRVEKKGESLYVTRLSEV